MEFDILWENYGGSGEKGRVNVVFMHEYPSGGPDFNNVDSLNKYNPFGRPAYHLRIRNSNTVTDKGYVGIGGGNTPIGRFYRHNEYSGSDSLHWLPGAVPPNGEDSFQFPVSSLQKNYQSNIGSSTEWTHVTFIIAPEKLALYKRVSSEVDWGLLFVILIFLVLNQLIIWMFTDILIILLLFVFMPMGGVKILTLQM